MRFLKNLLSSTKSTAKSFVGLSNDNYPFKDGFVPDQCGQKDTSEYVPRPEIKFVGQHDPDAGTNPWDKNEITKAEKRYKIKKEDEK